ncbi:MAG: Ig-like domain-containing protein [Paludibacteraceae bacterium]|nr:Ig-like domain-containing protein [Paludibacteraceae bacterium]
MKSYPFFFFSLLALCLCACNTSVPDYGKSEDPVFRIVQDTLRLSVGQTSALSLSVPLSGVEWASSVDSVAVVDWRGKVTALSLGSALVTASRLSSSGSSSLLVSDTCVVLVLSAD